MFLFRAESVPTHDWFLQQKQLKDSQSEQKIRRHKKRIKGTRFSLVNLLL